MVAIITTGYSIRRTFLYNENKVSEGVAECLMAANYPMELPDVTQGQRLNMLLKTADLNPDVKRNNVHITLNFAPGESFSDDKLRAIASEYMERIGFGEQPFLVYKHNDAGHPHLHISTVKIRPDGSKIDMQNIGKLKSEPARIELEKKYGLIKAEDHKKDLTSIKPVDARKVMYGKIDTKRAIGNVLAEVLSKFKFTSLPELNAVLNLYTRLFNPFPAWSKRKEERDNQLQNNPQVYNSGIVIVLPKLDYPGWKDSITCTLYRIYGCCISGFHPHFNRWDAIEPDH